MNLSLGIRRRRKFSGLATIAAIARKMFLPAAIVCLLFAGVESAHALTCAISNSPTTISFGTVAVPRDAPIGMDIGPAVTSTVSVSCPYNPSATGNSYYLQLFSSLPLSSVSNVWATGMAGIGVRLVNTTKNWTLSSIGTGGKTDFAGAVPKGAVNTTYIASFTFQYQLVKTAAQVTTGGPLTVGRMFYLISHDIPINTPSGVQAQTGIGGTTIAVSTCSVTTNPIEVTLPTISANSLKSVGASGGGANFQIQLQCGASVNVSITLTDATDPGNRTELLTLASDSTAKGVKLRITKSDGKYVYFGPDSPVAGNPNQWQAGPSSPTFAIPLKVQYVSTGAVTPGTVKAQATFTLSYQ